MTKEKAQPTITELIDTDEGLKSKRKLLTITSLILLALTFSGAKVEEANTFILKLKFENQNGIAILLVLSTIFLLLRYHNYASKYHRLCHEAWINRLNKEPIFLNVNPYDSTVDGLVCKRSPKGFDPEACHRNKYDWRFSYKCQFPLVRKIQYWAHDEYAMNNAEVRVGWKNYLKVVRLEIKYRYAAFFSNREQLDILAPYALGFCAIFSYFYHSELQIILNMLAVK